MPHEIPLWAWAGFLLFIAAMLALDLGVFRRGSHEVKMKEALAWCGVWLSLALAFNGLVWWWRGPTAGVEFFTGYLIEICLSVDNVFVFILLFSYFKVPKEQQHRVLFWGIVGAVLMRAVFIAGGIALLSALHWMIYVFGAFLVFTGVKMALPKHEEADPSKNIAVRLARKLFPITPDYVGGKFFVKGELETVPVVPPAMTAPLGGAGLEATNTAPVTAPSFITRFRAGAGGRLFATPLFIVLLAIETTDVVFAVDSIPAILGITKDGFIVFTSNIFAILGLRSLYFALAGTMQLFRFLGLGLALILVFIGVKMLLTYFELHVPIVWSLGIIGTVLGVSVVASLLIPARRA